MSRYSPSNLLVALLKNHPELHAESHPGAPRTVQPLAQFASQAVKESPVDATYFKKEKCDVDDFLVLACQEQKYESILQLGSSLFVTRSENCRYYV